MTTPEPPAGGPAPRPRRTVAPALPEEPQGAPQAANGHREPTGFSPAEKRLLAALEEMRAARAAIEASPPKAGTISAERYGRALRRITDIERIGIGPQPMPVAALTPPAEPHAYLVDGFIRPGTTVMLAGEPGSSKSWAARQLAITVAAGLHTFLNRYAIDRPLRVLVIDEDNGPDEEWRRDEALLEYFGLARHQLGNLQRISLAGVLLDQESWQGWLRALIEGGNYDLVILDPISEMHGGKELREDPGFRSMLGFLKRLKVDFPQLATLLVHHTRKAAPGERAGGRSLDAVRGQWGQTPDVVALVSPLGERRVAWELHKRVPHSKLILEASHAGPLVVVEDQTVARGRSLATDSRVLAAIDAGATTAEEIRIATGLSKPGVYKALTRLHGEAGLITKRAPFERIRDSDDPLTDRDE